MAGKVNMGKEELTACFWDTVEKSQNADMAERTAGAIKSNRIYKEGFISNMRKHKENAPIAICAGTTFETAKSYCALGRVAVLNFANPHTPGGGVENGAMAQEECLCRSNNLFLCLKSNNIFEDYYKYHREMKNYFFSDRLIYTKNITVFKDDGSVPRLMDKNEWFYVDVITCSAPFLGKRKYTNKKALKELFKGRVRNIFEASVDNGVDVLILGAFGCGAFKNPPDVVAEAFYEVIIENEYQKCFKQIVFAIKSTNNEDPFGPCPNILAFENAFVWNSKNLELDVNIMTCEFGKLRWTDNYPLVQAFGSVKLPSGRVLKGGKELNAYYEWRNRNKYCGRQFSILGDSISTLTGYNPKGYKVFYGGENCEKSAIKEMKDTWWGKVIDFFGGELLVNNSWSGSRVTRLPNNDGLFPSGCSDERTGRLHINSVNPDVIIVFLGVNDWGFDADICYTDYILYDNFHCASFDFAYSQMLSKIKTNYPEAEIWCCTLSTTFMSSKPSFEFPYMHGGKHIEKYNQIIKDTADMHKCKVIDLYDYHTPYDSIDGIHPNANGMNTLATLVIRGML